jgi:hypothetical protein
VLAVDGDAPSAIAALDVHDVRAAWLNPDEAVALLAWAGASGGRHGRRRGAAAGRDLAWTVLRALLLLDVDALPSADAIARLRWLAWDTADVSTGWVLRVAIEDPEAELSWVIDAIDPADEQPVTSPPRKFGAARAAPPQ